MTTPAEYCRLCERAYEALDAVMDARTEKEESYCAYGSPMQSALDTAQGFLRDIFELKR